MKTVYKYPLVMGENRLTMLDGPVVLVGLDSTLTPCVWVQGDPAAHAYRTFQVVGTGHQFPDHYEHVGSWFDQPFVWHLFEAVTR